MRTDKTLSNFKKNLDFQKVPFFFSLKSFKSYKKKEILPVKQKKRRNKILRHNKYTNVFQKTKIITYYSIKNKRKKSSSHHIKNNNVFFIKKHINFNEVLKTTYYNYYILCNKFFALYFLEKTDISKHFLRCFTDYKV